MARRRAVGAAISRGSDTIRDMVQQMIRARIQEESQGRLFEQQDKLLRDRERLQAQRMTDLEKLRSTNTADQYRLEHPETRLGDFQRLQAPIAKEMDAVTDLGALPTERGIENRMGGRTPFPIPFGGATEIRRPEITQLMEQRTAKQQAIQDEILRKRKEAEDAKSRIGPGGVAGFQGTTGFVPTERTTAQEGSRQAGVETAVGPAKARTAGMTEGARTTASIKAEHGLLDEIADIADAKRDPDAGSGQGGAGGREKSASVMLKEFKAMSQKINTKEGPEQIYEGNLRRGKALLNLDNDATIFQAIRGPLAMIFTVITQGTRPTDTDVAIVDRLFPGLTSNKAVAERLIALAESQIEASGLGHLTERQLLEMADRGQLPRRMSREQMFQLLRDVAEGKDDNAIMDEMLRKRGGGY